MIDINAQCPLCRSVSIAGSCVNAFFVGSLNQIPDRVRKTDAADLSTYPAEELM
jgi:hypothetical protein